MKRRVVVTGMGCITPIGNTVGEMWNSLKECASGVGPITYFDASQFPTKFASQVKNYRLEDYVTIPEPLRALRAEHPVCNRARRRRQ